MQVIDWQQFLKDGIQLNGKLSSMTVGIFDGVHRGHQALLKSVVSHNTNHVPVVVTFRQNHKTKNREQKSEIQSFQQRLEMFESFGIEVTIIIDFADSFRRMPGIEFLEILLKRGSVGFFAAGSNFRCGYKLDTDSAAIKKFFDTRNIPVEIVTEVMEGSLPISSSRIRTAINTGDSLLANKMLGHTLKQGTIFI